MATILEAKEITRVYGETRAVDNVSFALEEGHVHALIGESGSGKTTLARILGGIEEPFDGQVSVSNGKRVVLVQQDFVVWPELSVAENIAIGCRSKEDRKQLVSEIIDLMELAGKQSSKAGQLSYGQQQRVAIGRALAARPDVIILDEPFAHLDVWLRRTMWERCIKVFKTMSVTSLWITHIVQDALPVADEVMVMVDGGLAQSGSAESIYSQPRSHSVAKLTGPYSHFSRADWATCGFDLKDLFQPEVSCVGCRPEQLKLVEDEAGVFAGSDIQSWFMGPLTLYTLSALGLERPLWATSLVAIEPSKQYRLELTGNPFVLE